MSATIVAKSGVTLLFGIGTGIAAITGYIVNDDTQEFNSKKTEAYDAGGATVAIAYFDQVADIKFTALVISGTAIPTPGTTMTVASSFLQSASKTYIAEGPISVKEKNNGFTMIEVPLKRYVDNLIPS